MSTKNRMIKHSMVVFFLLLGAEAQAQPTMGELGAEIFNSTSKVFNQWLNSPTEVSSSKNSENSPSGSGFSDANTKPPKERDDNFNKTKDITDEKERIAKEKQAKLIKEVKKKQNEKIEEQNYLVYKLKNLKTRVEKVNTGLAAIIGGLKINREAWNNCKKAKELKIKAINQTKNRLENENFLTDGEIRKKYTSNLSETETNYDKCLDDVARDRTKMADIKNDLRSILTDISKSDDSIETLEADQINIRGEIENIQSKLKLIEDGKYGDL